MQEQGKKILIVEDDIDVLTLIYTTLLPMDFILEATLEVSEIKLRIERFRPDLILIGSALAGKHELDIVAAAHQQYEMQVIVIGDMESIAVPLFKQFFISDFLVKPVEALSLIIKINNLLPA